jgi:hypothetical protein
MNTQGFQHHRARDVNYGGKTPIRGTKVEQIVSISVDASSALTIYASATVTAPPALRPYVTVIATVEWGHGGATVSAEHEIGRLLTLPLCGSRVDVAVRLVDRRTGRPPSDEVSAVVHAFAAPGTEGAFLHRGHAVVRYDDGGEIARGAQNLVALRGFSLPWGGTRVVMLFDTDAAPQDGAAPALAAFVGAGGGPFVVQPSSPRVFVAGVWWAVSRTPDVLTRAADPVHLEAELAP